MAVSVLVHLNNEEAVQGEMEELPSAAAQWVTVINPRRRDGKDLPYLQGNVSTVMWTIGRVAFIEVLPGEAEQKLVTFVRE